MQLPDWLHEVAAILPSPFTGKIEINCFEDGVAGVNATISFKPPKKISLDKHQRIIVAIRQDR